MKNKKPPIEGGFLLSDKKTENTENVLAIVELAFVIYRTYQKGKMKNEWIAEKNIVPPVSRRLQDYFLL